MSGSGGECNSGNFTFPPMQHIPVFFLSTFTFSTTFTKTDRRQTKTKIQTEDRLKCLKKRFELNKK